MIAGLALIGLYGCGGREPKAAELFVVHRIPLDTPAAPGATLGIGPEGGTWMGLRGSLLRVNAASGAVLARVEVSGEGIPRIIGSMGGWLYAMVGDRLMVVDTRTGTIRAERRQMDPAHFAIDPRGRHLYMASPGGAVFGLDPASLRPLWAWPRLGVEVTAVASSPLGDRLYLAVWEGVGEDGRPARLLTRDVQTGRVLADTELPLPARTLTTDAAGRILGLAGEGADGTVWALRPGPEGARTLWRRSLRSLALTQWAALRASPVGGRIAVFAPGEAGAFHLLDAESGEIRGSIREVPLDAAFSRDTTLILLYPEEIRVAR